MSALGMAAAIGVGSLVEGFLAREGGREAAAATGDAARIAAQSEREALDYLKEVEAMPRYYRDQAMELLGAEFGLTPPPAGSLDAQPARSSSAAGVVGEDRPLIPIDEAVPFEGAGPSGETITFGGAEADLDAPFGFAEGERSGVGSVVGVGGPRPFQGISSKPGAGDRIATGAGGIVEPRGAEGDLEGRQLSTPGRGGSVVEGVGVGGDVVGAGRKPEDPQLSPFERAALSPLHLSLLGRKNPNDMFIRALNNPFYKSLYKGIEDSRVELKADQILKQGEESIMRQRNITGGLRGGGTQRDLFEFGAGLDERLQLHTQLEDQRIEQERNALTSSIYDFERMDADERNAFLVDAYNRQITGLSGFADLTLQTENIAERTSNIGNIQAQGIVGQGQIQQQTKQNIGGAVVGGIGNYLDAKIAGLI